MCTEEDFRDLSIFLFLFSLAFGECNELVMCCGVSNGTL